MAQEKEVKVNWTSAKEAILVQTLLQEKEKGNQAESGWKPIVWQVLVEALATIGSKRRKEAKQIKTRWQRVSFYFYFLFSIPYLLFIVVKRRVQDCQNSA